MQHSVNGEIKICKNQQEHFNRLWYISTTPNTTKKKIVQVQTNTVVFYGHPELSGEEKSKFEFEEKKFSIVLKMEIY